MVRMNKKNTEQQKEKETKECASSPIADESDSSADESDASQSGQSNSQIDKEKELYTNIYGKSIKRKMVGNPLVTEPAPKRKRTKNGNYLVQSAKSISETSEKRRNKLIEYALDAGFRIPAESVPSNLPVDKSQWTREDYKKDNYGPVYVALQNFVPDYLREENKELLDDGYKSPVDEEESEDDESDDSSIAKNQNMDDEEPSNAGPKEQEYITVNDDDDDIQIVDVVYNVEPTEKQKEIAEINKREEKRAEGRKIMLASHPDDQHGDGKTNCTQQ